MSAPLLNIVMVGLCAGSPYPNMIMSPPAGASGQFEQQAAFAPQISDGALRQMEALMEEKRSRTPRQQKIQSRLLYAARMRRGEPVADGVRALRSAVGFDEAGKTLVDIKAEVPDDQEVGDALRGELERAGVEIVNAIGGNIRARISLERVEEVAAIAEVSSIREAEKFVTSSGRLGDGHARLDLRPAVERRGARVRAGLPELVSRARRVGHGARPGPQDGAVTAAINISQGDVAHRAAEARNFYGHDGTGVKVGVLSDGVRSLASLQASGDLPQGITVLPGQAGSGDEGSAMLEIIHDIAPGAQLFFATAIGGIANFAKNIRDLRFVHRCDIIVDDILYLAEPVFQDGQASSVRSVINGGLPAQVVKDVVADGALYFSSVGSGGNKNDGTSSTWEGDYRAVSPAATLHDFGGGAFFNTVLGASSTIIFQWSDPVGASGNDYDIAVFNSSLTQIVDISADVQNGNDDAVEVVQARPGERVVINNFQGRALPRLLSLRAFRGRLAITTDGSAYGHCAVDGAFAVGAVWANEAAGAGGRFNGTEPVEAFSSDGGRRLLFNGDGSQITPGNVSSTGGLMRQKPDICAADGVATATQGFNPFFGTSAAAPHAAAIAALLLSARRSSTPSQIRAALVSSALDIEAPGVDRDSGAGIIMAFEAMQAIGATPLPRINGASVIGKKLLVEGQHFGGGAVVLLNGASQKTANDQFEPATRLVAKKAGKKIAPGQAVTLRVRNPDGQLSREFRFIRPSQ